MTRLRRSAQALLALALVAAGGAALPATAIEPPRLPCDPLDPALCLFPFPNDRFTTPDASTDTGKRIDFLPVETPRSVAGKPIDPTEFNRNDGYSPGSMILTFVPGLDLHETWGTDGISTGGPNDPADHIADIGRYQNASAPILIVDATTGERHPFWSELDNNAFTGDDERTLILRPAVNFQEGHRYLVALRNMREADGDLIPAGAHFAAYRDGTPGPLADPTFEEHRRDDVEAIIDAIEAAEIARGNAFDPSDLYLAWDFTVASKRNLSERVLHIRDDAFEMLGDTNLADGVIQGSPPQFDITLNQPDGGTKQRRIEGTITVPNYLNLPPKPPVASVPLPPGNPIGSSAPGQAVPGGRFLYGPDGLPMQNPAMPTIDVTFVCTIPAVATAAAPAHPMLYGHGLLGHHNESAGSSSDRMRERNFMPCATQWMGFADYDYVNAIASLTDPSNAPSMMDRAQQGFLNMLYLGRVMAHPLGFAADAAFQTGSGDSLIETGKLVYDGNSQGGIMGGALAALGVDHTRATLGVPGMNYSTLLNRSVDWEGPLFDPGDPDIPAYSSVLYTMFPDKKEQQLVMAMLQMVWDRAEGNGYAHHMTDDPLPNTPAHRIMLHVAYGDFQVTNVSAEVEARTVGARVMDTALLGGRHWDVSPYFGLQPIPKTNGKPQPWAGSALVYWDSGNLKPPNANVPPALPGGDPHEDPRRDPKSGDQRAHFFRTGEVIDVHDGGAYLTCRPGAEGSIPRGPMPVPDWCV